MCRWSVCVGENGEGRGEYGRVLLETAAGKFEVTRGYVLVGTHTVTYGSGAPSVPHLSMKAVQCRNNEPGE